jgi:hypothetical protein
VSDLVLYGPWYDPGVDEDDYEDEDDFEEPPYTVYWPSLQPCSIEKASKWTSPREVMVDAHEDEAYVYWMVHLDGVSQAHWDSRLGRIAFDAPLEAAWECVNQDVRPLVSPEYKELPRFEDD